ncbi:MAG: hypothetical protein H9535_15610 [Ignavibacteria bacterium]|nr:hypothetical protein [Ignavibacteria bacterium]
MGLSDSIICDYPLPDVEVQHQYFQTKDLGETLNTYRISAEGRLFCIERFDDDDDDDDEPTSASAEELTTPFDTHYIGALRFYTSHEQALSPPMLVFAEGTDVDVPSQAAAKVVQHEWFEYHALFIDGKIANIVRVPPLKPYYRLDAIPASNVSLDYSAFEETSVYEARESGRNYIFLPLRSR